MDPARLSAKQVWHAALERVRERVSAASFTTWFKATEGWEYGPGELVVAARDGFAAGHLQQRFGETARTCVADVLGRSLDIRFVVRPHHRVEPTPESFPSAPDAATAGRAEPGTLADVADHARATRRPRGTRRERVAAPAPTRVAPAARAGKSDSGALAQPPLIAPADRPRLASAASAAVPLTSGSLAMSGTERMPKGPGVPGAFSADPAGRHVFASFVVGTKNQFAYAAATQVAMAPGQSYNPLFIYGGTGLGKTHLLLAMGHEARRRGLGVCYVSAERFTNDIIDAIRHHTTDEFRARYRTVDVLLVDDIQFIAGKESTEEEFFHTFNTLHESNRQIVLSSDRVPRAMRHLHDRLRSRFEWGLIADIQPPDFDHRVAILRAKALSLGATVPDHLLQAIAQPDCASVRELEGALNRVLAYASMMGTSIDEQIVARALGPLRTTGRREVTSDRVLTAVGHRFGVPLDALRGAARDRSVAWPRQVAMYAIRETTSLSLSQIGECLGGRDHTTVMHGCAHVAAEMKAKAHVRQEVDDLLAELQV